MPIHPVNEGLAHHKCRHQDVLHFSYDFSDRTAIGPLTLRISIPLYLLLVVVTIPAFSQPETQHVINAPWRVHPKVELTLHGRFRTRPTSQGLYQGRVGALLGLKVTPTITPIIGYYHAEEENTSKDWEGWNRFFGGTEHTISRKKGVWAGRHLAELFDAPRGLVYFRVRHRIGYEAPTRLGPYTNVEIFWDRQGWRSVRYQGGLRYKITPRTAWDFHYFHEPRRQDVGWWARNMWGTTLEVRLGDMEGKRPKQAVVP
jgi:hypothetical protein